MKSKTAQKPSGCSLPDSVSSIPVITGFTGRERELSTIKQFFPRQRVMVIQGMPGVGKTALAAEFARHLSNDEELRHFALNSIWITCDEGWKFDSLFHSIDAQLTRQGEPALPAEGTLEDKIRHLVAVMDNNPRILFIDDFHNLDQPRALIMLKTLKNYLKVSKVIIMTRHRLEMPAIDRVDIFERRLEGLEADETADLAVNLFAAHSGDVSILDKNLLAALYNRCHGHPYAIKLFISLLIEGDVPPEEILDDPMLLSDELGGAFLEKMLDTLDESCVSMLKKLIFFRQPVKRDIFKLNELKTNMKIRRSLEDRFLLESTPDRLYSVPKIVKDYVASGISSEEKSSIQAFCLKYYCSLTKPSLSDTLELIHHSCEVESWQLASENLDNIATTMLEQGMLAELIELIEELMEHVEISPILKLSRAKILTVFGVHDKSMAILDELQKTTSGAMLASVLSRKAEHYLQTGLYSDALPLFTEALTLYEELKDADGEGSILQKIGIIHHHKGDLDMAEALFRQSLKIYGKLADHGKMARAKNHIGIVLQKKGRFDEAEELFKEAIETEENNNNIAALMGLYHNLANTYREQGDFDNALILYKKSLDCSQRTGSTTITAGTWLSLANIYRDKGEFKNAENLYKSALEIFEEHRHIRGIAFTLNNIGVYHLIVEEYEEALQKLEQAYKLFEDLGDKIRLTSSMLLLGRAHSGTGDNISAARLYSQGITLAREAGLKRERIELSLELARIKLKDNNFDEVITLAEEASADCELIEYNEGLIQCLYVLHTAYTYKEIWDKTEEILGRIKGELLLLPDEVRQKHPDIIALSENQNDRISYMIYEAGTHRRATRSDVEKLRSEKDRFDLWLDIENKELIEKESGQISVIKRRTVVPLLSYLIKNAGNPSEPHGLFKEVWQRPYDPESDAATLRVNISRLRKMIEPGDLREKYISVADEGGYIFSSTANYCMITTE